MVKKAKEWGLLLLSIFITSFFLNFVWESFHSVFLYEGHNFNAARYVSMMGYVSNIDSMLILGMYVVVAVIWKNLSWIKFIHECTRPIVNGFSDDGCIIGIHDAVNKTNEHPLCDQRCLTFNNDAEQFQIL